MEIYCILDFYEHHVCGVYMFRPVIKCMSHRVTQRHYDSIYLHVIYVLCMKYDLSHLVA